MSKEGINSNSQNSGDKNIDLSRGVRGDENYCFLLQFDFCDKNDCFCERPMKDNIVTGWDKYSLLLHEAFEEIESE